MKQNVLLLTHADVVQSEEGVHVVDICHELAVTECEISHVSARLGSCQHLEQSWSGTSPTSHKRPKPRVRFIIPGIITDTGLLTFLGRSEPGGTGQKRQANVSSRSLEGFHPTSIFRTIKGASQLEDSI